jgi:hypothetical protein
MNDEILDSLDRIEELLSEKNVDFLVPHLEKISSTLKEEISKIEFSPDLSGIGKHVPKPESIKGDLSSIQDAIRGLKQSIEGIEMPELNIDLEKTNALLEAIVLREDIPFPGQFTKDGRLKVQTEGISGGGVYDAKVANSQGQFVNPATEEKQDAIISAVTSIYTTLWDSATTANTIYIGEATPGTTSDQALWRIQKINTSTGKIEWADGGAFTQVYDNKESLTYA